MLKDMSLRRQAHGRSPCPSRKMSGGRSRQSSALLRFLAMGSPMARTGTVLGAVAAAEQLPASCSENACRTSTKQGAHFPAGHWKTSEGRNFLGHSHWSRPYRLIEPAPVASRDPAPGAAHGHRRIAAEPLLQVHELVNVIMACTLDLAEGKGTNSFDDGKAGAMRHVCGRGRPLPPREHPPLDSVTQASDAHPDLEGFLDASEILAMAWERALERCGDKAEQSAEAKAKFILIADVEMDILHVSEGLGAEGKSLQQLNRSRDANIPTWTSQSCGRKPWMSVREP